MKRISKILPYSCCKQSKSTLTLRHRCKPNSFIGQGPNDQHIDLEDSDSESTNDVQNTSSDHIHTTRRSKYTKPLAIATTVNDNKAKECSNGTDQPRCTVDESEFPPLMATDAMATSLSELESDLEIPGQMANVIDANQEWEIRDIIAKEDVDGVMHYLVEWSPTLMPKYTLGKAKGLVNKFEARLRAQGMRWGEQKRGRRRPSKAAKKAL